MKRPDSEVLDISRWGSIDFNALEEKVRDRYQQRAKRLRQLQFGDADDPVEAYLQFKRGRSKRSRKVASEMAQIKDALSEGKRKSDVDDGPSEAERNGLRSTG